MAQVRLAIISPNPADNSQGVERFCHTLAGCLGGRGIEAVVISRAEYDETKYDIVLTNVFESLRTRLPRIHVYHGCHIPQIARSHAEASLRWRAKYMVEAGFREFIAGLGASRVSVSNSCAKELRRWYGFKSLVISNGIDTDVFRAVEKERARKALGLPPGQRMALFIGRPEWRKRPDIASAAAREHGYEMYLAAGRPYEGMHWLGKLSPETLALGICAADVILMPTQYEACSLALLEGLASGTPVVTTDAGWVPDLVVAVPEYAALVSPVGDSAAFSKCLGDLEGRLEAVSRARDHVRANNNLEEFGKNWAETIHSVLVPNTRKPQRRNRKVLR